MCVCERETVSLFCMNKVKIMTLCSVVRGVKVPGAGTGPACLPPLFLSSALLTLYPGPFCYVQTPYLCEEEGAFLLNCTENTALY